MSDRALGEAIAISVATAVPFEEQIVNDAPKPDAIVFNLETLFRNFWGSYSNDARPVVSKMFHEFLEELTTIRTLCENQKTTPIFYVLNRHGLKKRFPNATFAEKRTEKQVAYDTASRVMLEVVHGKMPDLLVGDSEIPNIGGDVWLLTSFPLDLLSRYSFNSVKLLESQTGRLKDPHLFIGKLRKEPELQHLPFNSFTYQLFGDSTVSLRGQSSKVKKAVLALAADKMWRNTTTLTRIRENLSAIADKEIREQCLLLAKAK